MKQLGKLTFGLWLCFALFGFFHANAQSVWSTVQLNKKSVYVGEPVQVSITVYTSTWFTSGVDLGNIKVDGAFTVYFRPVSRSFTRGGKNYSGVELIYHVFPYSEDDINFPSLDIEVETPAPGGYRGIKRTVKSKAVKINVLPIPPNFEPSQWLVATSLNVSESWSGSTTQIKVGDVLERSITRNAGWTVAELIPPTTWDSLVHVSIYPGKSSVHNAKSKTYISAQRTESVRYLFVEEGEVVIPDKIYTWYNSRYKKLYKRTLKGMTIQVQPNDDLGMLESVRDSLQAEQQQLVSTPTQEKEFLIMGMTPKKFAILVLLVLVGGYLLYRCLKWFIKEIISRRKTYLKSEKYYFNRLLRTLNANDNTKILNALYRWIDTMQLKEPTEAYLIQTYGRDIVEFSGKKSSLSKKNLKQIRKNYLHRSKPTTRRIWMNP